MFKLKKKKIVVISLVLCILSSLSVMASADDNEMIFPEPLKLNDTVAIIAPANPGTKDRADYAVKFLKDKGFKVSVCDDIELGWVNDFTGEKRADAFNKLVRNPEIKAIFCLRGGYGSMEILDKIDYEAYRKNRPMLIGYSDITAMHIAIVQNAGVVTFHGPMTASNKGQDKSFDLLFNELMDSENKTKELVNIDKTGFKSLNGGTAQGEIIGGNMTLISSLMGTPYEINLKNKILFIEELDEPPYKLRRILRQLKLAGNLDEVSGVVVGDIYNCDKDNKTALETILKELEGLNVPVVYNVHAGHDKNPITIPLGAQVKIDGDKIYLVYKKC